MECRSDGNMEKESKNRDCHHTMVQHHLKPLQYGLVVTYCIVYHYTKRMMLARLLANEGPAIYVVHLNRYFVILL